MHSNSPLHLVASWRNSLSMDEQLKMSRNGAFLVLLPAVVNSNPRYMLLGINNGQIECILKHHEF